MRDATVLPTGCAQPKLSALLCLLVGLLIATVLSPSLAAPQKGVNKRPAKVTVKKVPAEQAPVLLNLAPTIHDQILLLERSANFWRTAGTSVEGVDQRTAWLLALACQERALLLRARRAKQEGDQGLASQLVARAEAIRRQWKRPAPPRRVQPGMMEPGAMMEPAMMEPGMMAPGAPMEPGMMPMEPGAPMEPAGAIAQPMEPGMREQEMMMQQPPAPEPGRPPGI